MSDINYIYFQSVKSGEVVKLNSDPFNSDIHWINDLVRDDSWKRVTEEEYNQYWSMKAAEAKRNAELQAAKSLKVTLYFNSDKSDVYYILAEENDFPEELADKARYALYEVAFDIEIDKETGNDIILEVRYGKQVLRPYNG